MKKQSHLDRAITWFNQIKTTPAKHIYGLKVYNLNMWIELFEAAEAGEI